MLMIGVGLMMPVLYKNTDRKQVDIAQEVLKDVFTVDIPGMRLQMFDQITFGEVSRR